jgi:hypothetical protein
MIWNIYYSLTVHAMKEAVVGIKRECGNHTIQGKDSASWQWDMGNISCHRTFIIEHHRYC